MCCSDLRLLNKSDFKLLLKWRLQMLKEKKELIRDLKKQQAEEEGRPFEEDEDEAKTEKEEKKEEEKDVSAQLQEVRERVAVRVHFTAKL